MKNTTNFTAITVSSHVYSFRTSLSLFCEMALLHYFKPKDGLPDPRGVLSLSIPSSAIAQANMEVQKTVSSEAEMGALSAMQLTYSC